MNILFIYDSAIVPNNGGIQRVTFVLSDYFEKNGHKTYFLSRESEPDMDKRQYVLPCADKYDTADNLAYLNDLYESLDIDIIINQDGMHPKATGLILKSNYAGKILISVAHSSLTGSIQNIQSSHYKKFKKLHLLWTLPLLKKAVFKHILMWIFKITHKPHYKRVIEKSDMFVLLADGIKEELNFIWDGYDTKKVCAIGNPCTIEKCDFDIDQKQKTVLYVGRIDYSTKRNDLLLYIWQKVSQKIEGWSLVIVGDGDDLDHMKQLSQELNLANVVFVGRAKPDEYYKNASVFCMTSAYEGFGLVLVEAMTYGVVPMAFNTYAALQSIIDDEKNGIIISPFDLDEYAEKLVKLIENQDLRHQMAQNAMEKSKAFSVEKTGQKWLDLCDSIKKSKRI